MQSEVWGQVVEVDGIRIEVTLRLPTLCPVCFDSGYCPNKLDCLLVCWCCERRQLPLFPAGALQ